MHPATQAESSVLLYSSGRCSVAAWEPWRTICFQGSWLLPVLTPWSVWVLLPESCERSMTSVVMIFQMTRDYAVVVPLMISNLVSFLFRHVCNANLSTKC